MYFQHFFALAASVSMDTAFLIAIGVLACVLGVEIAGIAILIGKVMRVRRERLGDESEEHESYNLHLHSQMAAATFVLGAVPMATQIALLTLAICTAVGALAFVLLLIILYAKGYVLAASAHEEKSAAEQGAEQIPVEMPESAPSASDIVLEQDEEQKSNEADDADAAKTDAKASEQNVEQTIEETPESVAVVRRETGTTVTPNGIPVYSSAYPNGQIPVVEKHITETYREIIKETNTTTTTNTNDNGGEKYSPATEEILKAIAELMKLGTQLRMEKEMAVENPADKNGESVPAFAETDEDERDADDTEEDDADEIDTEDAADSDRDEETDGDDYESDLFGSNERIVGFDEETGCYIVARYRKSFEAKLIQTRPEVKKYYSEIKNALLSYENNKDRISWTINTYTNEHTPIAKINVRNRTLDLYLALDPATLEDSAYHGRDVGDKKKYAETPFLFKVNSQRKLTLALELVQRTCEEQGLSPIDVEHVSYEEQYPFEATEELVRRGLIREYLREEKPAATFELAPDHKPELPKEDESVIPANANFTWELDDEQPTPEETIEEIPAAEPEPRIEEVTAVPAEESVPTSATVTTTHETIKTTERHYSERYIGAIPTQQAEYTADVTESTRNEAVTELASDKPVEETAEDSDKEPTEEAEEYSEEEPTEETEEYYEEEPTEETEEYYEEEPTEETEEYYEEEPTEETEEYYEEEPTEEAEEYSEEEPTEETEEYYEEEPTEEAEEYFEEEPTEETEEYYEEEPTEETEEYYEEEPTEETEEYYEEEQTEETEEYYEEEPTEEAEEYSEEEPTEETEEYYEEEPTEETEEYYEEEPTEETEEYYEEEPTEETEEYYEEEPTEGTETDVTPAPEVQTDPTVVRLDVCVLDDYFENGAIVNIETLKQVGLAPESATTLKLYATGPISGRYTVEANHFTIDAVQAIRDADGESFVVR